MNVDDLDDDRIKIKHYVDGCLVRFMTELCRSSDCFFHSFHFHPNRLESHVGSKMNNNLLLNHFCGRQFVKKLMNIIYKKKSFTFDVSPAEYECDDATKFDI